VNDDEWRATLGTVGVWSMRLRGADDGEVREAAAELDELGLRGLWIPGLDGAGVFTDAAHLLTAAPHSVVVLAVLGIWGQSPADVVRQVAALDRVHGRRAVIGLGVSSPGSAQAHGQVFGNPIASMSTYLDGLGTGAEPLAPQRQLLGALGPRMVELAARRTAGIHPFLVPPEYIAAQRVRIGAGPFIAPHQAVVLETDPARARAAARAEIGMYIGFPAYQNNLRRLGFDDADLVPGGSDRLIDALVAWGSLDDIQQRLQQHLDAGADHVAVHVLGAEGIPRPQWRELATLSLSPTQSHPAHAVRN
jgi:probable F420-dependent oxidoreductase